MADSPFSHSRRALLFALVAAQGAPTPAVAAPMRRRALAFPADFGAHPDEARVEWWYITGELKDVRRPDEPCGFQVTFFRSRTDVPATEPSRFAARELVFAHAAVTDLAARRLRHDQRVARAGFGIAEAARGNTDVRLRDWTLMRDGGSGIYRTAIRSDAGGFAFELAIAPTQPLLLQGEAGWSRKGTDTGAASLYYSEPQLAVTGRLVLDGQPREVTGRAWLDHEWSEAYLAPEAAGWDWIGMNLDGDPAHRNAPALMAFRMRRRVPLAGGDAALWAGGSYRAAGGEPVRDFAPGELRFEPLRLWRSPASQASYPVDWRVTTPAGVFQVRARLDDQELDSRASTGAIYWEGLSDLLDANGRRIGSGYLEMTGYAHPLKIG